MAYTLQAVVAKAGVLAQSMPDELRIISLNGGIEMAPLGKLARKLYGISFCPLTDEGDSELPEALAKLCQRLSQGGTIAYIEAELFGGVGTQASALFRAGAAFGPVIVSDCAIDDALHTLGVSATDEFDEFDTVGLGQHRETDQWLE